MKKALKILLLTGALAALLCVGAYAAESTDPGVYNVSVESAYASTVTLTPLKADGSAITSTTVNLKGTSTSGFYANAEKFTLTYSGAFASSYYLVLLIEGADATPTTSNLAYINQDTAASATMSFVDDTAVYPSSLKAGSTYHVYLASNATTGIQNATEVASFQYYMPYTLGDVLIGGVEDGININDAMAVINHVVEKSVLTGDRLLAANVLTGTNEEGVNINDAMQIINYVVEKISSFN